MHGESDHRSIIREKNAECAEADSPRRRSLKHFEGCASLRDVLGGDSTHGRPAIRRACTAGDEGKIEQRGAAEIVPILSIKGRMKIRTGTRLARSGCAVFFPHHLGPPT